MNLKQQTLISLLKLDKSTTNSIPRRSEEKKLVPKVKPDKFGDFGREFLARTAPIAENKTTSELWVDKYRPTSINDMVGLKKKCGIEIEVFLESRKQEPYSSMQMLLISGPNGVGKTVFAELMLKKKGFTNIVTIHPNTSSIVKSSSKKQDEDDEEKFYEDGEIEVDVNESKNDKTGFNVESLYAIVERLNKEQYSNTAIILDDIDALGGNFSIAKLAKLLSLHKESTRKQLAKYKKERDENLKIELGQLDESKRKTRKRKRAEFEGHKIFGLPKRYPVPLCTIVATTSLLVPFSDKKKLGRLKNLCCHVQLEKLNQNFMEKLANKIVTSEKLDIPPKIVARCIEAAQGDARRLTTLLQFINDTKSNSPTSLPKILDLIEKGEADVFQQDLMGAVEDLFQKSGPTTLSTIDNLVLRKLPSAKSAKVESLDKGASVYPSGQEQDEWIEVHTDRGTHGWILLDDTVTKSSSIDLHDASEALDCDSFLIPAMVRENYTRFLTKYTPTLKTDAEKFLQMDNLADMADIVACGDSLAPSIKLALMPEQTFGTEHGTIGKLLTIAEILPKLPKYMPSRDKKYEFYPKFPTTELCVAGQARVKAERFKMLYETIGIGARSCLVRGTAEFPCDAFQCADKRWIYVNCGQRHWQSLCQVLDAGPVYKKPFKQIIESYLGSTYQTCQEWSNLQGLNDADTRSKNRDEVSMQLSIFISNCEYYDLATKLFETTKDADILTPPNEWIEDDEALIKNSLGSSILEKIEHASLLAFCIQQNKQKLDKWLAKNDPKVLKKNQAEAAKRLEALEKQLPKGKPAKKKRKLQENEVKTEEQHFASHYNPIGIKVPRLCAEYGLFTFEDISEFDSLSKIFSLDDL